MRTNILFLAIGLIAIFSCKQSGDSISNAESVKIQGIKYEVKISGMTCTGCEQTIQSAVSELEGIGSVTASHTAGNAIVEFDSTLTDTNQIKEKINQSGYLVLAFLPSQN